LKEVPFEKLELFLGNIWLYTICQRRYKAMGPCTSMSIPGQVKDPT
jgi:hypothetical protein